MNRTLKPTASNPWRPKIRAIIIPATWTKEKYHCPQSVTREMCRYNMRKCTLVNTSQEGCVDTVYEGNVHLSIRHKRDVSDTVCENVHLSIRHKRDVSIQYVKMYIYQYVTRGMCRYSSRFKVLYFLYIYKLQCDVQ